MGVIGASGDSLFCFVRGFIFGVTEGMMARLDRVAAMDRFSVWNVTCQSAKDVLCDTLMSSVWVVFGSCFGHTAGLQ